MGRKLTAETYIAADLGKVWEFSQEPAKHKEWDIRFTDIEFPKNNATDPQRFRYATRIGFGVTVEGWGETVGDKTNRSSALRFGSVDRKSIIAAGAGSWVYRQVGQGTHFSTVYDYETRYGLAGKLIDALIFRPLMIWATRWSFDRLRLWLEKEQHPALSFHLWINKTVCRVLLGIVWVYEGLIPKILFVSPSEVDLVARSRMYMYSPEATLAGLGIMEVLFGVWTILGIAERRSAFLSLIGLLLLPMLVVSVEPGALADPYGGLSKNLGLIGCAITTLTLNGVTPRGYICRVGGR